MTENDPASIYETYLVPAIFEPLASILIHLAHPLVNEYVLDAACGTGVVARSVAAAIGSSRRITGVDFDPVMIAKARSLRPDIAWQEGDLHNLPFEDSFFDLVICQQGLQFLPDREAGLRQLYRVLRPGGRMVLGIWTELAKSPGHAVLFAALGRLLGTDTTRPPAWSLTDENQILKLVSAAGFIGVETATCSLQTRYPGARRFVEILVDGSSKVTREALAQVPAARRGAFIDEVVERLVGYQTNAGLELPMETRLLVARKR